MRILAIFQLLFLGMIFLGQGGCETQQDPKEKVRDEMLQNNTPDLCKALCLKSGADFWVITGSPHGYPRCGCGGLTK